MSLDTLGSFQEEEWMEEFSNLNLSDSEASDGSNSSHEKKYQPPKFVVNPIIYVDGDESSTSSDEEYSSSDEKIFNNLSKVGDYPFRTFKISDKTGDIIKHSNLGFLENSVGKVVENLSNNAIEVSKEFTDKLQSSGFETDDPLPNRSHFYSVSILLNRPLSISTRKNNLLKRKMNFEPSSWTKPFNVELFGVFWEFQWYDQNNRKVNYEKVRAFYKKLKHFDKNFKKEKAEAFREFFEDKMLRSSVPFQELREAAKNHLNTKKLVKKCKNCDVYLSIVDGDTISFNGMYSEYLRLHRFNVNYKKIVPTIMSTGYQYTSDTVYGNIFKLASEVDMKIRVVTALYVPLGIYYPEPNTCILVLKEADTVEESFISEKKAGGDKEMSCLLRKIRKNRKNISATFVERNPLITSIPERAKEDKRSRTMKRFSDEFCNGASPTKPEFNKLKEVTQSCLHENVWCKMLFINGAIEISKDRKKNSYQRCISLISIIRRNNDENAINELKKYIDEKHVNAIVEASDNVRKALDRLENDNTR